MNRSSHHSPPRPTVYVSAVDLWLVIVLLLSPMVAFAVGIYLWREGDMDGAKMLFLTAAVTLAATLIFVVPCRYTVDDDELHIRCGIISYRVPIKLIDSVERSRTLISGPALSLNRVIVKTKLKNYILSPRDRDAFIDDITTASALKRRSA